MIDSERFILVTGGAGFIGSALIHALNQRGLGSQIIVSDLLGEDEKWRNLVPLRYADYLEGDQLRAKLREAPEWFKDVGTVFHLGACSATTEKDARYLVQNNFQFTQDLAEASLTTGARFVYASSAATYGDGEVGMDDCVEDLHRLRPLNMYGYSKQMFDLWAQQKGILNQMVGLKYFNVFGPNEAHKGNMRSLVAKAYEQVRDTGEIKLFRSHRPDYQDGEQKRDFLYVRDAVAMTIHLAETPSAGGLFNLGSGLAQTWNELAKAIFAAFDQGPQIRYIDMPDILRDKYQYYTCADISKLRSSGYQAEVTPLVDSVRDYVRNYLMTGRRLGDELS